MSREETQKAWKNTRNWVARRLKRGNSSASISPTTLRRSLLIATTVAGTLTSAVIASKLPCQFEAQASFLVAQSDQGLPATSLLNQSLVDETLAQAGWVESTKAKPTFDLRVLAAPPDRHQITVLARCENPADASLLSIQLAENLARHQFSPADETESLTAVQQAQQKWDQAEARYREALADWGKDNNSAVPPNDESNETILQTNATEAGDDVFTAPSMVSPSRAAKRNLVESALIECQSRRHRLADLYTQEHPAVIALDRQIAHLEALIKESAQPGLADDLDIQSTQHEATSRVVPQADLQKRKEEVERLAQERNLAMEELRHIQAVSAESTSPLPPVVSSVLPGPEPLRVISSSRTSFFVGWTGLLVLVALLVEGLAIFRATASHYSAAD
jgi:hypothetical protein